MNKLLTTILAAWLPIGALAALTIVNSSPTNVTATSAWLNASVTATGAANPSLFIYWGTADGSTNASSWTHTNTIGVSTVGTYSAQITGLPGSTIHYFRGYATNGTETNWASYSSQFITLTPATSAPPASTRGVSVDTNGYVKSPTNVWTANRTGIVDAITGLIPAGTGNVDTVSSNLSVHVANTNNPHAVYPAQIGAAGTGTVAAVSNQVAGHLADTNNPHAVTAAQAGAVPTNDPVYQIAMTNGLLVTTNGVWTYSYNIATRTWTLNVNTNWPTPAQIGAAGTGAVAAVSNQVAGHLADTNNPHAVYPAQIGAVPTNDTVYQTAMTNGLLVTTNNTWTLVYDIATRTWTLNVNTNGGGGSGTFDYSALSNYFGNTNALPMTLEEKAFATNRFSLSFRTNLITTTNGAGEVIVDNNYLFDDTALKNASNALNTATNGLQIQVNGLKDSTNALNTATNSLQVQMANFSAATQALNTATNALNANKLNLSGGTMVGAITMGTNVIVMGTNPVSMNSGYLGSTQGLYFLKIGSTSFIPLPP